MSSLKRKTNIPSQCNIMYPLDLKVQSQYKDEITLNNRYVKLACVRNSE